MKRRLLSFVAAVALATPLLGTATAGAADTSVRGEIIGSVKYDRSNPTSATITARYRCSGEWHLWVSVKQSANGKRDPRLMGEGSSEFSDTWLQNHPEPSCTGGMTTSTFTVDLSEYGIDGDGLVNGVAWVQFCLTQENEENGGFLMDSEWAKVAGQGRPGVGIRDAV